MTTTSYTHSLASAQTAALARWLGRWARWNSVCTAMRNAGVDDQAAALAAWRKASCPSKASKSEAYDTANRLIALLSLDVARPSTVADLHEVLAAAHRASR